eukprot:scaffold101406_cov58-Phaeocystis_antarctica.AAC.1
MITSSSMCTGKETEKTCAPKADSSEGSTKAPVTRCIVTMLAATAASEFAWWLRGTSLGSSIVTTFSSFADVTLN